MLKFIGVLGLSVALSLSLYGLPEKGEKKTVTGYVVDAMCAKGMAKSENPAEKAAKHTKACALEEGCAASGFGVFSEGKFHKFDEAGDKMALEVIQKSKTEKGMMLEVTGEMKGESFAVSAVKEHMMEEMKKEEMKKEEGKMEKQGE